MQSSGELAAASALVVGSEAQVDVAQVQRVAGADQYATCVQLAQYALAQGMTVNHVAFATGKPSPMPLPPPLTSLWTAACFSSPKVIRCRSR